MIRLLISAFILLVFTTCSDEVETRLSQAEELVLTDPESVRKILAEMDDGNIRPDDHRMRIRLLKMAVDSCRNRGEAESVCKYFSRSGDRRLYMMGLYYRGLAAFDGGESGNALMDFGEALKLAVLLDESGWFGRIMQAYYDVYISEGQLLPAPEFYSTDVIEVDPEMMPDADMLDFRKAWISYGNGDYHDALERARSLLGRVGDDGALRLEVMRLIGRAMVRSGVLADAERLWTEICGDGRYSSHSDSVWLVVSSLKNGSIQSNDLLVRKVESRLDRLRPEDRYEFYLAAGDSIGAFVSLSQIAEKSRAWNRNVGSYGIYERIMAESALEKQQIYNRHLVIGLWLSGAIVILLSGIMIYFRLTDRKKHMRDLDSIRVDYERTVSSMLAERASSRKLIWELLKNKYEAADRRCIEYYGCNKARLSKDTKTEADSITGVRNFVSKLEADVNLNMSDLIQHFRSDVVGLKEADYCLYLFSVVDLSVITIAVLLGEEKIEAVYNRKARLKLKIKQLDCEKADKYMAYL